MEPTDLNDTRRTGVTSTTHLDSGVDQKPTLVPDDTNVAANPSSEPKPTTPNIPQSGLAVSTLPTVDNVHLLIGRFEQCVKDSRDGGDQEIYRLDKAQRELSVLGENAVPALLELAKRALNDKDQDLLDNTICVIDACSSTNVDMVPLLKRVLTEAFEKNERLSTEGERDKDSRFTSIAESSARVLERLGANAKDASPILAAIVKDPHVSFSARASAAKALGSIGFLSEGAPPLKWAERIKRRAWGGPDPITTLLQDDTVPALTKAVTNPDPLGRRTMIPYNWDPTWSLRHEACTALGKIKDQRAVPALMQHMKRSASRGDLEEFKMALDVLIKIGGKGLDSLVVFGKSQNPGVREIVARELKHLADSTRLKELKRFLKDPVYQVRAAAVESLSDFRDTRAIEALADSAFQSREYKFRKYGEGPFDKVLEELMKERDKAK